MPPQRTAPRVEDLSASLEREVQKLDHLTRSLHTERMIGAVFVSLYTNGLRSNVSLGLHSRRRLPN